MFKYIFYCLRVMRFEIPDALKHVYFLYIIFFKVLMIKPDITRHSCAILSKYVMSFCLISEIIHLG